MEWNKSLLCYESLFMDISYIYTLIKWYLKYILAIAYIIDFLEDFKYATNVDLSFLKCCLISIRQQ